MDPLVQDLVQFGVLGLTVCLWWVARRDLKARAGQSRASEVAELEQLRATVEALAADLEQRAEAADRRLARRIAEAAALPDRIPTTLGPADGLAPDPSLPAEVPPEPAREAFSEPAMEDDPRYASVLAMVAAGISDPTRIARRTGVGRAEVELLLSLRARRGH